MAITIGTLHLPTDKIQEEALKCLPASTYPLYQQERLSLYNAEWENPDLLESCALALSKAVEVPVLEVYCMDEDIFRLRLWEKGEPKAQCGCSLFDDFSIEEKNIAAFPAAFKVEDPEGRALSALLAAADEDEYRDYLEELSAYFSMPLVPDADIFLSMEEESENYKL